MNVNEIVSQVDMLMFKGSRGRGSKMAISTSKIKKIIAIIKNRRENGIRERENGENPHSNGDVFSRSMKVFFLRRVAVMMIVSVIMKIGRMINEREIISFPVEQIFSLEVRYN
jgi:hypothetical protein